MLLLIVALFALFGWWIHALFNIRGPEGNGPNALERATMTAVARVAPMTPEGAGPVATVPEWSAAGFGTGSTPTPVATSRPAGRVAAGRALPVVETPTPSVEAGEAVRVQLARYWPDDGPDWCAVWEGGRCVSPVTSGLDWRQYDGRLAACPAEWLGRLLVVPGVGSWFCEDTGVSAVCGVDACVVLVLSSGPLPLPGAPVPGVVRRVEAVG